MGGLGRACEGQASPLPARSPACTKRGKCRAPGHPGSRRPGPRVPPARHPHPHPHGAAQYPPARPFHRVV